MIYTEQTAEYSTVPGTSYPVPGSVKTLEAFLVQSRVTLHTKTLYLTLLSREEGAEFSTANLAAMIPGSNVK